MKQATSTLTILLFILIPCTLVFSQRFEMEAGLVLGGANYGGDLVQPDLFSVKETKPAYGLFLRYPINPQFGLRANFTQATISGDDRNFQDPSWRQERAFNFKSSLTELALLLEWSPLEKRTYPSNLSFNRRVSPYLFAGVAGVFYNPEVDFSQNKLDQLAQQIEADQSGHFTNAQFTIPMGLGVKANISNRLVVGLEGGIRPGFTDYLDGVSQAGNPADKDWYGFAGATISYRIVEKDTDNDGIADSQDLCPDIPGKKKDRGCPDSDGDGVVDTKDECPLLPGKRKLKGCPDSDNDGIADQEDPCPGRAGSIANGGCPEIDTDNDGIIDKEDNCPTVAGLVDNKGCPKTVIETKPKPVAEIPQHKIVYFETNRSILLLDAAATLNSIVPILEDNPEYKLQISAYTDSVGAESNNLQLSKQRANACFYYLLSKGVSSERMEIVAMGEMHPVATNDSAIGRQLNRRAEIKFYQQSEY